MATNIINLTKEGKITSIQDALDASGLNFIAEEVPLIGTNGLDIPDKKAIFRADNNAYLGTVGTAYHPTQNSLAMAFMDSIVQKQGFHYSSTTSKDDGAVSIITATSDKNDTIRVGDEVSRQIKLINGFNGKVGFGVEFLMNRLVCTNGLVRNERESVMRFKHTIRIQERMKVALQIFDESVGFHEDFIRMSRHLAQVAIDKTMVEKFVNGLYGEAHQNESKKEIITDIFQHGKGNKGETVWDLYNGVTEYVDHHHGKDEKRLEYSIFGAGHTLKAKAWDLAVSMAYL